MAYPASRLLTRVSEPYRSPAEARRTGLRVHGGVDIALNTAGKALVTRGGHVELHAVGAGVVEAVNLGNPAMAGINVYLRLDGDGSRWWYNHNARNLVRPGQRLADGEPLAHLGATGNVTGPHCHLERHWPRMDVETDPWPFIKDEPDVNGFTSDWQTGDQPAGAGDAGTTEDEMSEQDISDIKGKLEKLQNTLDRLDPHVIGGEEYARLAKNAAEWVKTRIGGSVMPGHESVTGLLGGAQTQPLDPVIVAETIATELGDDLARQVLDALGHRITNG